MPEKYFIEVDCQQRNHDGERICGDVFLSGTVKEENRIVLVLSDGMGHGVKASVLATLTATMALNFTKEHKEPERTAEVIMNTLPECSERHMSYATFTILDINSNGTITILEYDNPDTFIVRNRKLLPLNRRTITLESEQNFGKKLTTCSFTGRKGDRIVFSSDGVAQSGLGSPHYPFGWENKNVKNFAVEMCKRYPRLSAKQLATRIINKAHNNDNFKAKDDISCGVVYLREPRELLICTGPPYEHKNDKAFSISLADFEGKKIVMGATTGEIIARELNLKVEDGQEFIDPDLPPLSYLEGIDLFTEGILTLRKAENILEAYTSSYKLGKGPADQVVKLITESDKIHFLVGTRINIAHEDPSMQVDLEIRRTVVKRIAYLLEEKFLKKVIIKYI